MHVIIRDPFGTTIAEGVLTVLDVPGIDEHTPSLAEEISQRFTGKMIELIVPETDPRMRYTMLVT